MGKKNTNNGVTVLDMEKYSATAKAWATPEEDGQPYDYELESGRLCLIKRIGMTEIFRLGLLDKLDFFSASLAEDDKPKKKSVGKEFLTELSKNFGKMEESINAVLLIGVIAPVLAPVPTPNAVGEIIRQEGVVYVDKVPFEDRVELFGEILDTEGLSDFREESKDDMGHVSADESLQDTSV